MNILHLLMFHSKDSLVILIIHRIAKPWGWKKLQVGVNLCHTPTIAYCEGCIKKISNVQKPISDGKPLKVAQHSNLDNVKTLTFYVHTSMYKSDQALMQGWEYFGGTWSLFMCFSFMCFSLAQFSNNLLQTSIHHHSCAMKASWQNARAAKILRKCYQKYLWKGFDRLCRTPL